MRAFRRPMALVALVSLLCATSFAQGNSWDKVRYNGGTFQTKVDPKDWDNRLTVTSDTVTFTLKDGQTVEIPARNITALSYGQEAHRRVGTMVALAILISPAALFGLFHKTRLHFIGIEYRTADGKSSGLLIQGHKDNYRAIMTALEAASGAPVSVSEKDREYVPGLANTRPARDSSDAPNAAQTGDVTVTSTPDSADVLVDGAFVGNTPSTLKLAAGKHLVKVTAGGQADWEREIDVTAGSSVRLNANLQKPQPRVRFLNPAGGVLETPSSAILVQGLAVDFPGVERVELNGVALTTKTLQDGSVEFHTVLPLALGTNTFEGVVVSTTGQREPFKLVVTRTATAAK